MFFYVLLFLICWISLYYHSSVSIIFVYNTELFRAKSHILQERFVANCYLEKVKEKTLQTKELCRDQEILHNKLENQYYTNFANVNMVKEKSSQLATNLNSMLNIMNQCKTEWRQTAGGLEQKLEEIEDVQKNSVQESLECITQKMLSFEENLHSNLETVETTLKSKLFPKIARMSNGYEEIKSAVDDWARITRKTSDEVLVSNFNKFLV